MSMICTVHNDLTVSLPSGDPDFKIKGSGLYFNVQVESPVSVQFNAPPEAFENFFNVGTPFTFAPAQPGWITNILASSNGLQVSFTINPVNGTRASAAFLINLNDGRAVDPTIVNEPPPG